MVQLPSRENDENGKGGSQWQRGNADGLVLGFHGIEKVEKKSNHRGPLAQIQQRKRKKKKKKLEEGNKRGGCRLRETSVLGGYAASHGVGGEGGVVGVLGVGLVLGSVEKPSRGRGEDQHQKAEKWTEVIENTTTFRGICNHFSVLKGERVYFELFVGEVKSRHKKSRKRKKEFKFIGYYFDARSEVYRMVKD